MDVRKLAMEACNLFAKKQKQLGFNEGSQVDAVIGFLQGVSDGTITTGQGWLALCLMNRTRVNEDIDAMIKNIYASGMCCEGQRFISEKDRTFTERAL